MDIYDDTIIYVLTPSRLATGGPNALHQLCYKLRRFKFDARVFYATCDASASEGPETHPNYLKYGNPVADKIIDDPHNIIIVPETAPHNLFYFQKIRKAIWWLSVDNYYLTLRILQKNRYAPLFDIITPAFPVSHFTDCFYARKLLELFSTHKEAIMPLRSYMDPVFIKNAQSGPKIPKQNYITVNPKKGFEFARQVFKYCAGKGFNDINVVPLTGFSQDELALVYKSAKLHMDFGSFPGRDRIPTEAALNDMCVITGKNGASKYYEDVPIPDKYKFETRSENIPKIAETIKDIIYNYDLRANDFLEYKNSVLGLERTFEKDIQGIFKRIE